MTVTAKSLIESKFAEAAETAQYTATNVRTIIDKFTACNTSDAAVTLSVKLIPFEGVAGTVHTVVQQRSLAANETYTFPEIVGHILNTGGIISTLASDASAITIRSSGREITG